MELTELSACTLRSMLLAREVTPLALLEASITRIAIADKSINAITAICLDEARAVATEIGAQIANGTITPEHPMGRLAGLPITIKDLANTKGMRTTYGSLIYADFVPERDDHVVGYIREAGGVVFAKTNTSEFGSTSHTGNAVFGLTRNPFDLSKTPGGSSGGAAAALAAGMAPLCHGSDTGGSLRVPANFCGVVSLKPTPGLIPFERRVFPLWPFNLQGPMARTVDDVGLFLSAMAIDDSIDPMSYPTDRSEFFPLKAVDLGSLRAAFSADLGFAPTSRMIRSAFSRKISRFRHQFASSADAQPDISDAPAVNWVLRGFQFLALHSRNYRDHKDKLSEGIRLNYEEALELSGLDLADAFKRQGELHRTMDRFFKTFDVLICPCTTVGPFPVDQYYVPSIDGRDMKSYVEWAGLTNALSTTGNPVVALPCGRDEDGLPFGLQIVGPRRSDGQLLRIAKALETAFAADPDLSRPTPTIAS